MNDVKLSILVCGITERNFTPLLSHLENQTKNKAVEVLSLVDNKKMSVGRKRNLLLEMSKGDYVSFIDDDDWVTDDYVDQILLKIEENADVITFNLARHEDGSSDKIYHYSLGIEREYDTDNAFYRLPNHLMAYKRTIASKALYDDVSSDETHSWFQAIKPYLSTSSSIDKVLYNYRYDADTSESRKNYLFSVIIPTMWASEKIYESVDNLEKCDAIGEIIIIDNNPSGCKKPLVGSKVKVHTFHLNIFVNPAWNHGTQYAIYDKVCLLNDDIVIEDMVFHFLSSQLERKDVGIVGLAKSCYKNHDIEPINRPFYLEKMIMRNRGWGCAIFFKKENYVKIPPDLKIWFGDDWLIKMNDGKVFRIHGPKVVADISQTSESPTVQSVVNEDVQNSIKYNLPWSNDYDL
jgi:glycosyltransferase involved in cell wall biosynthesis